MKKLKTVYHNEKKAIWIFTSIFVLVCVYFIQPYQLSYVGTESLEKGWYLLDTSEFADMDIGQVVVINYEAPEWVKERRYPIPEKMRFTKIVKAIPGDTIKVIDQQILRCRLNDCVVIAKRLKEDMQGRSFPDVIFPSKVPSGYYFLATEHERSFDSRYLGLFKKDQIIGKAYKI